MRDGSTALRWIAVMEDTALGEGEMRAVFPLGLNLVVSDDGSRPSP
jgi:hypothetical protein